ncbi:enoyl-CoA hydratase/isomerase family protein [Nocardioides endophyticus]|uniref:enoyl-CoA hydratase/isomerase family protein n=1 Tax=Nocardioides endophyticus TaxID=1353775 RepID=UPI0031E7BDCD
MRINRPEVHNALNASVLAEIGKAHRRLTNDPVTRAIIVTGSGSRAFSAGADLAEIAELEAVEAESMLRAGGSVMSQIEQSSVPMIGAINGLALGGGFELALSLSFNISSVNASFGLPESGLGLIPGYGGTQRLALAVGTPQALHLMLSRERLDADRAYALGLTVAPPVAPDALMDAALRIAEAVADGGPHANAAILRSVRATRSADAVGLDIEVRAAAAAISSSEGREGIAAFRSRRTPQFPDCNLREDGRGS